MTATQKCQAALHGTKWAYERHRCRCPETVAMMRERQRQKESRRKQQRRPVSHLSWPRYITDPIPDPIAVELACQGDEIRVSVAERVEAVRRLTASGRSGNAIADVLHVDRRTVCRYRAKLRQAAA